MPPRDIDSVNDMVQAALLIQEFLRDITRESFRADVMRQAAVVREIEILGEAARRLSDAFRAAHPTVVQDHRHAEYIDSCL